MFRFEHIEHLLLLLLIPVLILLFLAVLRWKKNTYKKIGDEKLVAQLTKSFLHKRYLLRFVILVTGFGLLIIAAANLQSATQVEKISRQGIDVMIALDVSRSMLSQDIKPSRLDKAKQLANKLMDQLQNDRIGLVVFAGRAYMQMPLTADHSAARLYISNASPEAVPTQGTVIAEALRISNSGFNKKDKKYKTILLITDGEDHDEEAVKTAKQLADNGVIINTIGVGTTEGGIIMNAITGEPKRDIQGNVIVSKLNERELIDIASNSNGIYQQLNDVESVVSKIQSQVASMEQKTINDSSDRNYRSFFQWFLVLALIGLIGELFISEKRKANK
ncbi:MAG: VWA domain-containing protein [Chitinophagaceae bacterium]|nr:VWA domain-containing protein [Chitinophagaceae bacterium]